MLITIILSYRFPISGFLVYVLPVSKREKETCSRARWFFAHVLFYVILFCLLNVVPFPTRIDVFGFRGVRYKSYSS